jgi:carbon monoxide dehydrogenase subunit G
MRLTRDLVYAAPVADVLAMLQDPAFWDRVAEATGALSSATKVSDGADGGGDKIEVVTDQQQAVTGVPAFAKKFVGDSTRAITTATWRGAEAAYVVDAPGKPTSIAGTVRVSANGSGTTVSYDLQVKASVPLVGGKLEKLVCELTGEGLDKEHAVGQAWLAG